MRRVLVVERSGTLGARLKPMFQRGLVPAGPSVSPALMAEAVKRLVPALVLVEVGERPEELVRAIELVMAESPTPIVLLTQGATGRAGAIALLAGGALDVLEVPHDLAGFATFEQQLELLASVKVVRHPKGRRKRTTSGRLPSPRPSYKLVAIAASLGGPKALAELLAALPEGFAAPITICQHISSGFSKDLAHWLATETSLSVVEAHDGELLAPGKVYVAPSHQHLVVQPSGVLKLDDGPAVGGFKPACDVLLKSAASFGAKALGVVLTGMGRDGAKGLLEIRARGGHTIAQDEATSVVFGMPGEAIALGAAELVLPLHDIPAQLVRWVA